MSEDNKYNGWTNYETWLCKLWMDNDEYICNHLMPEWAKDSEGDTYDLSQTVKDFVEDPDNGMIPPDISGFAADLINAALSEVNWYDIAESILSDYPYEDEDSEDETDEDEEDSDNGTI